ncbi:hypothetical protein KIS1582_3282 [Cytobacillus firmus]|uniref:Uncharacterized protein n=1 Tax=Cytobacillus firmus TaxID=1399 RepID=A0A800MV59_CYTFI|nr:hypothetical protein KIS1582_3282 [Cytobacillus firmus]
MRPRRRSRGGSHSSPRKASAWSGNQRAGFKTTIIKKEPEMIKEKTWQS